MGQEELPGLHSPEPDFDTSPYRVFDPGKEKKKEKEDSKPIVLSSTAQFWGTLQNIYTTYAHIDAHDHQLSARVFSSGVLR